MMASEPRPGIVEARHLARELRRALSKRSTTSCAIGLLRLRNCLTAATTILNVAQLMGSEPATELST
jgi:hypothetical protein